MNRDALHEPQTARLGWVSREWAEHPSRGLTPQRLHRILEDAEQGNMVAQSDLFTDMEEKDGHIMSEMAKRRRVILTLEWDVHEPANATSEEKRETAIIRELLSELKAFDDFLLDNMDAVGHGFAAIEVEWHRVGAYTLQRAFHHRPQRWFQTLPHDGNALRLRDGSAHEMCIRDSLPLVPQVHTVGTVLHYDSVLSRLLKNHFWRGIKFQAVITWPNRCLLYTSRCGPWRRPRIRLPAPKTSTMRPFLVMILPTCQVLPWPTASGKSMARRGLLSSSALMASNITADCSKASMTMTG